MRKTLVLIVGLGALGLVDSSYLTIKHLSGSLPVCDAGFISECGRVLGGPYSEVFGIPLAALGIVFYGVIFSSALFSFLSGKKAGARVVFGTATVGLLVSGYLTYLQFVVIGALCPYCLVSAALATGIFLLSLFGLPGERVFWLAKITGIFYRNILKKILFLMDAELVHTRMVHLGEILGKTPGVREGVGFKFSRNYLDLNSVVAGMEFSNPIGLAAGFDYEGRLTEILPRMGFGFQTIGTITNLPYGGNPRPMLGRLPKSRSLLVNKGFKNLGATEMVRRLLGKEFQIPVGVSLGRTNSRELSTQDKSVKDIVEAFKKFEEGDVQNSYYELNISCPNLFGKVSFYGTLELEELLKEVDKLKIKKPIFVKMPITESNENILAMLEVISRHKPSGVIIGNLQGDRKNRAFDPGEMAGVASLKGGFSGKPTFDRSNELISLAYKHYGKKLVIIGCGGVFNGRDAYEKILRGASLVQLITGLVFQGPQLVAEVKEELVELLRRDGFLSISEAVGAKS